MISPHFSLAALLGFLIGLSGCGGQPTRDLVIFTTEGGPERYRLATVDASGGNLDPIAGQSVGAGVRPTLFDQASWSLDGERIAFTAIEDESGLRTDIYVIDADGSDPRRLTHNGRSSDPVWSPDGRTLAFARTSIGELSVTRLGLGPGGGTVRVPVRSALWTMAADGSQERQLFPVTPPTSFDRPSSFAPDGRQLLFTRDPGPLVPEPESRIYALQLVASSPRPRVGDTISLNQLTTSGSEPSYSPDGERVVFTSDRDRNGRLCYGDRCLTAAELYVMDADGRQERRLTRTRAMNEAAPTWSPDGAQIAYQAGRETGNAQGTGIFAVTPNGTCRTAILVDPKLRIWYGGPAWRPGAEPGALACPQRAQPIGETRPPSIAGLPAAIYPPPVPARRNGYLARCPNPRDVAPLRQGADLGARRALLQLNGSSAREALRRPGALE